MNSVELERKMKLEYEAYENDRIFENFWKEEKDLTLAIVFRDFRLTLEKSDIRNAVKHEIWKAALR
jgi:hypothetical protein